MADYINLQLDEGEVSDLYRRYKDFEGDESFFRHLACYLVEELEKQYPDL